jgi:hypothetical protein
VLLFALLANRSPFVTSYFELSPAALDRNNDVLFQGANKGKLMRAGAVVARTWGVPQHPGKGRKGEERDDNCVSARLQRVCMCAVCVYAHFRS